MILHPDQLERLTETPVSAIKIIKRAYEAKSSPRQAIKAMCLQCVGYIRADVANCTAPACPLWAYRPYQRGEDDSD